MKISLVADSAADLPIDIIEKYDIKVVPMNVSVDDNDFLDGVNLSKKEFYEKMKISKNLPRTSLPSPQSFIDTFKKIPKENKIICFTISAASSGTYKSALLAKDFLPDYDIEVIDSLNISMGTGLQVIRAAELIKENLNFENLKNEILNFRKTINTFIAIDDLENVIKGGRISNWKGAIAQILKIKPILKIFSDGSINLIDSIRGRRRQLNKLLDYIKETEKDMTNNVFVILHAQAPEKEINQFKEKIKELLNPKEILVGELGPIMATHGGFGAIGVAF